MDITYDWFTDPTIGPVIAGAVEKAVEKATEEANAKAAAQAKVQLQAAREDAERHILRRLVEKRFGALSEAMAARIGSMPLAEIEDVSLRLLDVANLDELF